MLAETQTEGQSRSNGNRQKGLGRSENGRMLDWKEEAERRWLRAKKTVPSHNPHVGLFLESWRNYEEGASIDLSDGQLLSTEVRCLMFDGRYLTRTKR